MNDNEKMEVLVDSLLRDVNAADLPLGVKALALENLLLRVKMAMQSTHAENNASAQCNAQSAEDNNDEGDGQDATKAT